MSALIVFVWVWVQVNGRTDNEYKMGHVCSVLFVVLFIQGIALFNRAFSL